MKGKLSNIKNIAWAVAIGVCLLAVLVGLLFASITRHQGPMERPTVLVGDAARKAEEAILATAESAAQQKSDGSLKKLEQTADGGQAYIDSLTFLCDSALVGLRDYGLLSGGNATNQVWGSSAGNIPASRLADFTIRFPRDGSEISPVDAAMIAKPPLLVLSLGTDGLKDTDQTRFIADYEALITAIRQASPETRILVSSITAVTVSYSGADGLDVVSVNEANRWIEQICADTGVYFVDAADSVRDREGTLLTEYSSANGKTLNSAGLNQILEYLRTHTVP